MRRTLVITCVGLAMLAVAHAGCGKEEETTPATRPAASAPFARPADAPKTLPIVETAALDAEHLERVRIDINKGITWLLAGRNPDGGWGFIPGRSHPALTAMAVKALLQHGEYGIESPAVVDAFKVIMAARQKDGGFYDPAEGNANYVTAVVVMAMAAAKDPRQKDALAGAVKFLRTQQIIPGSKTPDGDVVTDKHAYAGGVSYGKHG